MMDQNAPPLTFEQEVHALLHAGRARTAELLRQDEALLADKNVRGEKRRIVEKAAQWMRDDLARFDAAIPKALEWRDAATAEAPRTLAPDVRDLEARRLRGILLNDIGSTDPEVVRRWIDAARAAASQAPTAEVSDADVRMLMDMMDVPYPRSVRDVANARLALEEFAGSTPRTDAGPWADRGAEWHAGFLEGTETAKKLFGRTDAGDTADAGNLNEYDEQYLRRLADEIDTSELTLRWRQDVDFLRRLAVRLEIVRCAPTTNELPTRTELVVEKKMQPMTLERACLIATKAHDMTPDDREFIEQGLLRELRAIAEKGSTQLSASEPHEHRCNRGLEEMDHPGDCTCVCGATAPNTMGDDEWTEPAPKGSTTPAPTTTGLASPNRKESVRADDPQNLGVDELRPFNHATPASEGRNDSSEGGSELRNTRSPSAITASASRLPVENRDSGITPSSRRQGSESGADSTGSGASGPTRSSAPGGDSPTHDFDCPKHSRFASVIRDNSACSCAASGQERADG